MPWTKNKNGERIYTPSIFTKEELPTWAEMYYEFYQKRLFVLKDINTIDPYWKIPRSLVLMAQCCNELNKMLYEDGIKDKIYEKFDLNLICFYIDSSAFDRFNEDHNTIPPIYTIPLPTGKPNPFMVFDYPRFDVSLIASQLSSNTSKPVTLEMYIQKNYQGHIYCSPNSIFFNDVLKVLMEEICEYYNGERPGWKDGIETTKSQGCITGFDPAL